LPGSWAGNPSAEAEALEASFTGVQIIFHNDKSGGLPAFFVTISTSNYFLFLYHKQMVALPEFKIALKGGISDACLSRGLDSFHQAADYIRQLPYGRNADKTNLAGVFADGRGTCGTKHALLRQLAKEQGQESIRLFTGLFRMSGSNTPSVAKRLERHRLAFIPEAHCYLKFEGQRFDFTKTNSKPGDFEGDLLEETELNPGQITDFKVNYHKTYLGSWLNANPSLNMSLDELWLIREQCIQDLSAP
jgi:hypothetical protein